MATDTQVYGLALARSVADYLMTVGGIYHQHRDYCGMGLWWENDFFGYGEVEDGWPASAEKSFASAEDFSCWLADQSDHSLSRIDHPDRFKRANQCLTRKRLEQVLKSKAP